MRIINRKNIISVICISFTTIYFILMFYELLAGVPFNPTHLNAILIFILTMLTILLLSQQYRLDRFSTITMLIIQYIILVGIIEGSLIIASYIVDIHPDGYLDMLQTFTVPYILGCAIYYIKLQIEIKKQNQLLNIIKKTKKDKDKS